MALDEAKRFFERLQQALAEIPLLRVDEVVGVLRDACQNGRTIYIMGNGGSAATASHFTCDLQSAARDMKRFRVANLSDNVPRLTALANDLGYAQVFREQLANQLSPGDIVILLSVSGASENIVQAAACARQQGALVVGLLGSSGGRVRDQVDLDLTIASSDFDVVESVHSALEHLISSCFRKSLAGE